ncbi:MAG TPA: hypothetical protein VHP11_17705 [Tepidisphaeraceae bacterium]|nr:hypothetical protein [Tepidisphaeraceae bacterium]
MSDSTSVFVLVRETLINVQTVCAASLVSPEELHLWFPGSSQTEGPSFTITGPEARELWAILKQSARSVASSGNAGR